MFATSWTLHSIGVNNTRDRVFALAFSGECKLVAAVERSERGEHDFEDRIFAEANAGSRDSKEREGKRVLAAIEDADNRGDFCRTALRSSSVLWISTQDGHPRGQLVHEEDLYSTFASFLSPSDGVVPSKDGESLVQLPNELIPFEKIVYDRPINSWRMTSSKASILSLPDKKFVYKGVTFYQFLVMGVEKFRQEMIPCYREIQMVNLYLKRHPGIISPAEYLVTVPAADSSSSKQLVVGSLYAWLPSGALGDFIDNASNEGVRIPLERKAKWCHQLCSAIADVHYRSRAWHQDIKPGNILIDDNDQLRLCDWEQWGGAHFIRAPEVDRSLNVHELDETVNGRRQLKYSSHEGPPRQNSPVDPFWNVFPDWIESYPVAAELAEVYSLGKTLWVLLEQAVREEDPMTSDYTTIAFDWKSKDLPRSWKDIVDAAVAEDPNARPLLSDLVEFWERAKSSYS